MAGYAASKVGLAERILRQPETKGKMAEYVAAAALLRAPGLIDSVLLLTSQKRPFEAQIVARVVVELAITIHWMGRDEDRAEQIRDDSIRAQGEAIKRCEELGLKPSAKAAAVWERRQRDHSGRPRLPRLPRLVEEARDLEWVWEGVERHERKSLVKTLYLGFYDPLSAPTHADLRTAKMIVNGAHEAVLGSVLAITAQATWDLLVGLVEPLGLEEAKELLMKVAPDV
jgi:hypothetical protein